MANAIYVEGCTAPSGTEWVIVHVGERRACVPYPEFRGAGSTAIDSLSEHGVTIVGSAQSRSLIEKVANLTDFPPRDVIENVGWNGCHFALPDGTVFSPEGITPSEVIFARQVERCSERGSLKAWREMMSHHLSDQSIAVFALCLAFVAPILKLSSRVGNFGFELVGEGGAAKSVIQLIVSSVFGGALKNEHGHYWISFNSTLNGFEQTMAHHNDLLMILDEASLFQAEKSPKVRASGFRALAFQLSNGSEKKRFGGASAKEFRFAYLSSSNEPLAQLIGDDTDIAKAAADRLITIQITPNRPYGAFDALPAGIDDKAQLIETLIAAVSKHHGKAIRRYLRRLVDARYADQRALKQQIATSMETFRTKAGVDRNDGSAVRVADAFGFVYAAGELAKTYGALPKAFNCGKSVMKCYRLHLARSSQGESFEERLLAIASGPRIIDLGKGKLPTLDGEQLGSAVGFIRSRGGKRELWVDPGGIYRLFPDWKRLKSTSEVKILLVRDGKHLGPKRQLQASGKPTRMLCFKLPKGSGQSTRTPLNSSSDCFPAPGSFQMNGLERGADKRVRPFANPEVS